MVWLYDFVGDLIGVAIVLVPYGLRAWWTTRPTTQSPRSRART